MYTDTSIQGSSRLFHHTRLESDPIQHTSHTSPGHFWAHPSHPPHVRPHPSHLPHQLRALPGSSITPDLCQTPSVTPPTPAKGTPRLIHHARLMSGPILHTFHTYPGHSLAHPSHLSRVRPHPSHLPQIPRALPGSSIIPTSCQASSVTPSTTTQSTPSLIHHTHLVSGLIRHTFHTYPGHCRAHPSHPPRVRPHPSHLPHLPRALPG